MPRHYRVFPSLPLGITRGLAVPPAGRYRIDLTEFLFWQSAAGLTSFQIFGLFSKVQIHHSILIFHRVFFFTGFSRSAAESFGFVDCVPCLVSGSNGTSGSVNTSSSINTVQLQQHWTRFANGLQDQLPSFTELYRVAPRRWRVLRRSTGFYFGVTCIFLRRYLFRVISQIAFSTASAGSRTRPNGGCRYRVCQPSFGRPLRYFCSNRSSLVQFTVYVRSSRLYRVLLVFLSSPSCRSQRPKELPSSAAPEDDVFSSVLAG